jgi:hypothetical protein
MCPNEDEIILFLFPALLGFVSDLESELDASMEEVFRLDLDCSCPSVPVFPPLECHMTLYDTVGCIVKPLPVKDLLVVLLDSLTKKAEAMMHGDEGIGLDGLEELDPDPSTHDGIMGHGPSHIHYELVALPLQPVASNHLISAFQQGHQAFPLVKVKTTNGNTYGHNLPTPFQSIRWCQNHLTIGRTCYIMPAFNSCGILLVLCFIFCFVKASR